MRRTAGGAEIAGGLFNDRGGKGLFLFKHCLAAIVAFGPTAMLW